MEFLLRNGDRTHWSYPLLKGCARQIEELVEGVGDVFAVGAAAIVVEEDDGGVFCALVGRGDPIPGAAASSGEAKAWA